MHHLRYLREFLAHKWHVFRFCWKLGIPWRGITHDLSRFRPSEWFVHARFFGGRLSNGEKEIYRSRLDRAWLKHVQRNDHHWENWSKDYNFRRFSGRSGAILPDPLRMRPEATLEMLADWQARALYRDRKPLREWYEESDIVLHPATRREVERLLPIVEKFR